MNDKLLYLGLRGFLAGGAFACAFNGCGSMLALLLGGYFAIRAIGGGFP